MQTAIKAEHELHRRRLSRNIGLGLVLIAFVALVYGLTVVKVSHLGDIRAARSGGTPAAEASQ